MPSQLFYNLGHGRFTDVSRTSGEYFAGEHLSYLTGWMAGALGMPSEAARWAKRADAHAAQMVHETWDDTAGLFWAIHPGRRAPVRVKCVVNLLPLLTGVRHRWLEHTVLFTLARALAEMRRPAL